MAQTPFSTHWQASFKPILLPVLGAYLLLTVLAVLLMLKVPHFDGRFDVTNDVVVYATSDGRYLSSPSLSGGGVACPRPTLPIEVGDVVPDLHLFDDRYSQRLSDRQAAMRCLLNERAVVSGMEAGSLRAIDLEVRPRQVADLGASTWGLVVMALLAALISAWVWSLRTTEMATRLFAINGFSFLICFLIAPMFKLPLLGHDVRTLEVLYLVNELFNQVFFLSLLALFLLYPVRLTAGWRVWCVPAVLLLYLALVVVMPDRLMALSFGFTLAELVVTIALIGIQWWATRRRPGDRAALTWLALSVLVGAGLWIVALLIAERLAVTHALSDVYIVALFFPFYLGLAMGVARFCLVELQDWTFRILFFVMAALLFAAIDLALISLAGMAGGTALWVALMAIAFLYLPLRDLLWRRFFRRGRMSRQDMFAAVMEIAFAPTPHQRRVRWEGLVHRLFDPLKIEPLDAIDDARIEAEGLRLVLPAVADAPALALSYARQGRGLFSPAQVAMVRQLIALVKTAANGRDAYERGAAEERRRLAQDLHDDVGARLLTGLGLADDRTRPILQGALSDIRTIASGMMGQEAPLDTVMADVRHECVRRLEAVDIEVSWPLWPDDAPLVLADYRLQKALTSALREVVSNIVRHSAASGVRVNIRLEDNVLVSTVVDNGVGLSQSILNGGSNGQGLSGLRRRLNAAGGSAHFANAAEGGAIVELRFPLLP